MPEIGKAIVGVVFDGNAAEGQVEKFASGFMSKFDAMGIKADTVMKAGLPAAVVAGVAAAGTALYQLGSQFDETFDSLQAGTGATGDSLAGLKESFRNIVTDVPDDFKTVETALELVTTKLDLTGSSADDLTTNMLDLARLTKGDIKTQVTAVAGLFNRWAIATDQQTTKLDGLYEASRRTGVPIEKLAQLATDFAPALQNLGLGFDASVALLAQMEQQGINTEKVMGGLNKAAVNLAKEGVKDIPGALSEAISSIANATDKTAALSAAAELFGTKAAPEMVTAIQSGALNWTDLATQVAGAGGAIEDTTANTEDASEKWDTLKNKVAVALEPVAETVFDQVNVGLTWLMDNQWAIFAALILIAAGFLAIGIAVIIANWEIIAIILVIAALAAAFYLAWTKSETFRNAILGLIDTGKTLLQWMANTITFVNTLAYVIVGFAVTITSVIVNVIEGAISAVRRLINVLIDGWNRLEFHTPDIPGTDFGGLDWKSQDIQRLHSGGVFQSGTSSGEGLALLRDGELVLTPEQARGGTGASYTMQVYPQQADVSEVQAAFALMETLEAVQ